MKGKQSSSLGHNIGVDYRIQRQHAYSMHNAWDLEFYSRCLQVYYVQCLLHAYVIIIYVDKASMINHTNTTDDPTTIIIAASVGAVGGLLLLVTVIFIIACTIYCSLKRRRNMRERSDLINEIKRDPPSDDTTASPGISHTHML